MLHSVWYSCVDRLHRSAILFIILWKVFEENKTTMLDDDFFELDEDLLNATDFSKKIDEAGILKRSQSILDELVFIAVFVLISELWWGY